MDLLIDAFRRASEDIDSAIDVSADFELRLSNDQRNPPGHAQNYGRGFGRREPFETWMKEQEAVRNSVLSLERALRRKRRV